jgi:hypothetical protein
MYNKTDYLAYTQLKTVEKADPDLYYNTFSYCV